MAKVKEAKDKLTAYFKGKGLDTGEIRDAFNELDEADVDLTKLAESTSKNTQWQEFWEKTAVPEFQKVTSERDELKAKLAKLEAALSGRSEEAATPTPQSAAPSNWKPEEFERKLATATSQVLKSALGIGFKHYKQFGDEPDYDAMEKIMSEGKASSIEDAYRVWSEPVREKQRTERTEKEIKQRVADGIAAERSKLGIVTSRRKDADIEADSYSAIAEDVKSGKNKEKAPSESDLRTAFISDLNDAASGVIH